MERKLNRDNFQVAGKPFRLIEPNKVIVEVDIALGSFCATLYVSGSGTMTLDRLEEPSGILIEEVRMGQLGEVMVRC